MAPTRRLVEQLRPRLLALARGALWYAVDMAFVVALFCVYFLLRGLPHDRVAQSTRNAFYIIDAERTLGVFHEPAWQQAVIENERLTSLANFTYLNLHMPLLVAMGGLFFLAEPRKHRVIRNTILLSAFMAVPIYAVFPVTPPRLMGSAGYPLGIFDTIPEAVRTKPGPLANWYAAVPSYHFGWIALAVAGVWWYWKLWALRAVATAFAGLMWWAIVVTGNHYFLDMVAGAVMVGLAFSLVCRFERWADANPTRAARFTVRAGPLRLPF
ncbi:MAG: phosphatase PAP2 family protein [Dehalococcoidia bacterium]|nr:phosphatase PAP2 family protein [Dehalococcoidia bacterium]